MPFPSQSPSNPLPLVHADLDNWSSGLDFLGSLRLVLLEVLQEETAKLLDFGLEAILTSSPGLLGVEELSWDARAGCWDGKVEHIIDLIIHLGELTRVDGIEDGTSVLQWATLATGGGTSTNPAGVQQPSVSLVMLNLVGKHLSIAHGVESQEWLGKAGGEGCLWLGDANFGSGHLGGITRDEVEHSLGGVELRDGWEDTAGIAGEKDDVRWVVGGQARNLGVLDVLNGVGAGKRVS